eukprot:3726754-Rhodomonas_salina.4
MAARSAASSAWQCEHCTPRWQQRSHASHHTEMARHHHKWEHCAHKWRQTCAAVDFPRLASFHSSSLAHLVAAEPTSVPDIATECERG